MHVRLLTALEIIHTCQDSEMLHFVQQVSHCLYALTLTSRHNHAVQTLRLTGCHSWIIPAQRTRSKCTLVPQNVSIVHMATTTAVHIKQDTRAFESESTHCADDYRTTKISQPPPTESHGTNFTLFDKGLHPTLINDTLWQYPIYAPIGNKQG